MSEETKTPEDTSVLAELNDSDRKSDKSPPKDGDKSVLSELNDSDRK